MSGSVFRILNQDVIDRLIKDGEVKVPKKKVDVPKDERWNTKQMGSKILQGIEGGKSIPEIAKSMKQVIGNNEASAIRNTRTMVTSAQNHGRLDSYKKLTDSGVIMKKVWEATPDDRTRKSHIDIDGEEQDIDAKFSNGCQFPADGNGPAEEVWCCRCSMGTHIVGFKKSDGSISYVDYEPDETLHDVQMRKEKSTLKRVTDRITDTTLAAARKAEPSVTKALAEAVGAGSGRLEGLDYRFKGRDSLKRKIVDKSAKKGMPREEYAQQITDALRYTNVSSVKNLTQDFYTVKKELEKSGYAMIEIENTIWDKTAPYRGINTLVQNPDGYTFELQFHTPQSLEIKEINHKLYEEQRKATTTKERYAELDLIMAQNAQAIKTPVNSSKIVNKNIDKPIEQW